MMLAKPHLSVYMLMSSVPPWLLNFLDSEPYIIHAIADFNRCTAGTCGMGVHVQSDLSWHGHVMNIAKSKSSVLYQIIKNHICQLHLHVCFLPCDTLDIHFLGLHQATTHQW